MKEELSKMEKFREYIEEMWYRYQCYRKMEVKGWKYGYKPKNKGLRYYLKYSAEERARHKEEALARARYIIEHMDF